MRQPDFFIVGGGVIGVSVARELKRRFSDASVCVLEKEGKLGLHASGRNSGVLHAGFYYTADSLKARFTRQGNLALSAFCREEGIPLNTCGKLVVAQRESDLPQLDELQRRAQRNGVPLENVTEEEARRIEPRVRTLGRALFSPSTSTADPLLVLQKMREAAEREGVQFRVGQAVVAQGEKRGVRMSGTGERVDAGYVVNAAGLHADTVARAFGFSEHHRIVPFKGLYLYSDEAPGAFRTNIYPVPDLRNPFLGVHFTVTVDGRAKIGPTAIPAFWREQYAGWEHFELRDCWETLWREVGLFVSAGFDFRRLALEELLKYSRRYLVGLAGRLATGVSVAHYRRWGKAGIRAQLMDIRTRRLEMDFLLEGDGRSFHILNAVSPGWTCAIPFAAHVGERIEALLK